MGGLRRPLLLALVFQREVLAQGLGRRLGPGRPLGSGAACHAAVALPLGAAAAVACVEWAAEKWWRGARQSPPREQEHEKHD